MDGNILERRKRRENRRGKTFSQQKYSLALYTSYLLFLVFHKLLTILILNSLALSLPHSLTHSPVFIIWHRFLPLLFHIWWPNIYLCLPQHKQKINKIVLFSFENMKIPSEKSIRTKHICTRKLDVGMHAGICFLCIVCFDFLFRPYRQYVQNFFTLVRISFVVGRVCIFHRHLFVWLIQMNRIVSFEMKWCFWLINISTKVQQTKWISDKGNCNASNHGSSHPSVCGYCYRDKSSKFLFSDSILFIIWNIGGAHHLGYAFRCVKCHLCPSTVNCCTPNKSWSIKGEWWTLFAFPILSWNNNLDKANCCPSTHKDLGHIWIWASRNHPHISLFLASL